jgi:hypothetical protein
VPVKQPRAGSQSLVVAGPLATSLFRRAMTLTGWLAAWLQAQLNLPQIADNEILGQLTPAGDGSLQRAQLAAAPNHAGRWLSRSCWSSPAHATWPSGRSSTAGTSSSSLTSTTWSTRSAQPATESRPV